MESICKETLSAVSNRKFLFFLVQDYKTITVENEVE